MDALSLGMMAVWGVAAALLAGYAATVAGEVTYVTLADGRRQERSIPLVFKLLLPLVGNLDRLTAHPSFARQIALADEQLVSGGFEGVLNGREFVALKLLCPLVLGTLWCLAVLAIGAVFFGGAVSDMTVPACVLGVSYFYLKPMLWLRRSVKLRHLAIMKALPFVLDLLTLSVEAGLDFISALQRNCKSRKMDPLNEELLRMTKEIQIGVSRKEALRNMAERVKQPDLKSVACALIQADELGVSIGSCASSPSSFARAGSTVPRSWRARPRPRCSAR